MQKSNSNNGLLEKSLKKQRLEKWESASQLPRQWDHLSDYYFQERRFLAHVEKYNPCCQLYYLLFEGANLVSCAVVYSLKLDLFSFKNIRSPLKMRVVGLPVSVASPGIFGLTADIRKLLELIQKEEQSFVLALNLEGDFQPAAGIKMSMMPSVEFKNSFLNFQDYLNSLRAPYRRRYNQLSQRFEDMNQVKSQCDQFTSAHYLLYREIIHSTKTKLEILSLDFFVNLPDVFVLTSIYIKNQLVSWYITCHSGDTLFFFFGGHSDRLNDQYHLYFNNLFEILKEVTENGYLRCDFGQTAEIPKLRLGGAIVEKSMVLYHQSKVTRWLIGRIRSFLEYNTRFQEHRVLKNIENVLTK